VLRLEVVHLEVVHLEVVHLEVVHLEVVHLEVVHLERELKMNEEAEGFGFGKANGAGYRNKEGSSYDCGLPESEGWGGGVISGGGYVSCDGDADGSAGAAGTEEKCGAWHDWFPRFPL